MQTKTLGVIAVLLALVIAGFFVLAPKGGEDVAVPAPISADGAAAPEAVPAAAEAAAPAAAASTSPTPEVIPQPDSFAVPPVDLDLPADTPSADAAPPAAAAAQQP